jgi:tetratricopeptide repeat protein 21B
MSMAAFVEQEKVRLSEYCVSLAEVLGGSNPEAESLFQEALQSNPHNSQAMLGLAKLLRGRGDLHGSVAQCRKVAMGNGSNAEAVTMLSENLAVLHQQQLQRRYEEMEEGKEESTAPPMDAEEIVKPLKDFLKQQPNNYKVLERLIVVLRRMGLLDEIPAYMEAAEKNDKRSVAHSGYHYCKGLYARYTNDVIQAIQHFNLSRKDIKSSYGEDSLIHMVELYLNPDQDGIWTAAIEDGSGGSGSPSSRSRSSAANVSESTLENLRVAEVLLQELKPICRDQRRLIVLENYSLMATRLKHKIDQAMNSFIDLLEADPEYLPGILGMATGFMIDKNQHKARNILKRVGKMDMLHHDGEDFEKANLFLAKFSADKTKNDNQTQELCKKCLVNNKSCSQAWDILGTSYERDTDFVHACECYEKVRCVCLCWCQLSLFYCWLTVCFCLCGYM